MIVTPKNKPAVPGTVRQILLGLTIAALIGASPRPLCWWAEVGGKWLEAHFHG